MPKAQPEQASDRKLKRGGIAGVAIGALALIACELPIFLAVVGLGGLSAKATAFRPPEIVEVIAIVLSVIGAGTLLFLLARRILRHRKARQT